MSIHLVNTDSGADANDEELGLITDYVAGAMTNAAREAFENRMAADEGFFNRVAPYLKIWLADVPPESILRAGVGVRGSLPPASAAPRIRRRSWIPVAIISMAAGAILTLVVVNQRGGSRPAITTAANTTAARIGPDSGRVGAERVARDQGRVGAALRPGSLTTHGSSAVPGEVIEVALPEPRMTYLVPDGVVEAPLPRQQIAVWPDDGSIGRSPLLPPIKIGPSAWGLGGKRPSVFKKPPFRFKR